MALKTGRGLAIILLVLLSWWILSPIFLTWLVHFNEKLLTTIQRRNKKKTVWRFESNNFELILSVKLAPKAMHFSDVFQ